MVMMCRTLMLKRIQREHYYHHAHEHTENVPPYT